MFAPIRHRLALSLGVASSPLAAQHFHRLPATPHTVAYGYYSAAAVPVLRIASGDTVEVETRSEEHTSELQSHSDLVCRLLLEKKKQNVFHPLLRTHAH